MSTTTDLKPTGTYTFTITGRPRTKHAEKTIQRLMRMQPEVQRGLTRLAKRRATKDNDPRPRAGRIWVHRAKTTKLTVVEPGASFTLRLTPHILPDVASVSEFLSVSEASG